MRKENKRRHGGKDGRQALKKSRDRQFGDRRASSNKKYPVVQGTVSMTREGYAFVEVPEEPDNDVFVKASKTRGALNGDIVKVAVTREKPQQEAFRWNIAHHWGAGVGADAVQGDALRHQGRFRHAA